MNLDLKNFRKVAEDENTTTLKHIDEGHELKIKHALIDANHVRSLKSLPTFDDGGQVHLDPDKTKAFVEGFTGKKTPSTPLPKPIPAPQNYDAGGDVSVADRMADPIGTMQPSPAPAAQVSSPPQQAAAQPPTDPYGLGAYGQTMNNAQALQLAGTAGAAQDQAAGMQNEAGVEGQAAKAQQDIMQQFQHHSDETNAEIANLQKAYDSKTIDPDRYVKNLSSDHKTRLAIGMLLAGFNPTSGPNTVIQHLHDQIQNDVEAQKADMDKGHNMLTAAFQKYGNIRSASEMALLTTAQAYANKIKQAGLMSGSKQAVNNGMIAAGQLMQGFAPLTQSIAARQTAMGAGGETDPAQLVPFLVPKEHQAQALKEIEAAQNTNKMRSSIDQAFEQAAKENTVMRTGAGLLRTPGSVYALHQAMQPTFKDLEGTVRQAAMDNTFKNITPAPGDDEHKIAQKRQAKDDYLSSKLSAPTAKAYNIDLGKFNSTKGPVTIQEKPPVIK